MPGIGLTLAPDEEFLDLVAPLLPTVDYFEIAPETTWWEAAPPAAPTSPRQKSSESPRPLAPRFEVGQGEGGRVGKAPSPHLSRKRARGLSALLPQPVTGHPAPAAPPLAPNGFHHYFAALGRRLGKPFVGHGVGYSLGTASRADAGRTRRWLQRLAQDHAVFDFRWYTDHLGATSLAGQAVGLPLPLPYSAYAAAVVRRRLAALQRIVPDVGVENTAQYFLLGEPLGEPAFLGRVLRAPRSHLLLDLHNLYTMAQNLGFPASAYLDRLDRLGVLGRVIEIHLSGGSVSDGSWLPSGRALRLDSHDTAVPEPVWQLLTQVLPRCPNLRGITLERMEGTIGPADVPLLASELERIRHACAPHATF